MEEFLKQLLEATIQESDVALQQYKKTEDIDWKIRAINILWVGRNILQRTMFKFDYFGRPEYKTIQNCVDILDNKIWELQGRA